MGRGDVTDREWSLLEPHLPSPGGRGGWWSDHRIVLNGGLFRARTGVPWRDLPERHGSWKTVCERHRRWSVDGAWDRLLQAAWADADLAGRIDWGTVGFDSACCRAHQHTAGSREAKPRLPKRGRHPGTTAPMRDSDGPGAARPPRSTVPVKAAATPWLY